MRTGRTLLLAAAVLLILLLLTHSIWLPWPARWLVQADEPSPSDAILVLAGDFFGDRILHASSIAGTSSAPRLYVSGPTIMYGRNEADLAIDYASSQGYPRQQFVPLYIRAGSTSEEAAQIGPELRRRGVRRLLIVTSGFHTRRAGRIWRAAEPGLEIRMIAAPFREFHTEDWWKRRQDRKTVLLEWEKTVAEWFGL